MFTNFLQIRIDEPNREPTLKSVCAGYEQGEWRATPLSKYLIRDCLLDFALTEEERLATTAVNAGRQLADAADWLYNSPRYQKRGEVGELLLHIVAKQFYGTRALITKIYFKDSQNDTVKGFDCVHVSGEAPHLDLWLGEVKFYDNAARAVRDVTEELKVHLQRDYLHAEFVAITRKFTAQSPDQELIRKLTDRNISLDKIFENVCIPVLLTYDSSVMSSFKEISAAFLDALRKEVEPIAANFKARLPPSKARVHLCLLPLAEKAKLTKAVHEVLVACQALN